MLRNESWATVEADLENLFKTTMDRDAALRILYSCRNMKRGGGHTHTHFTQSSDGNMAAICWSVVCIWCFHCTVHIDRDVREQVFVVAHRRVIASDNEIVIRLIFV
jgi:hypothetical protein